MSAIALTIAGSDSSGGAGIQADLKTFAALGTYGASVLTALTAQNTRGVRAVHHVPPAFIADQLDAVFEDLAVGAVKVGMVGGSDAIEAVAGSLRRHGRSGIVLDPVMVATSGARLLAPDATAVLVRELFPLALVVTPNLPEAAVLLGEEVATTESAAVAQALRLARLGPAAILVKGGHGTGPESTDLLVHDGAVTRLPGRRIPTRNTHGTGCTLSAAITAFLARGTALPRAVEQAKSYVASAIEGADRLSVGEGPGPVHHFHAWWGADAPP